MLSRRRISGRALEMLVNYNAGRNLRYRACPPLGIPILRAASALSRLDHVQLLHKTFYGSPLEPC